MRKWIFSLSTALATALAVALFFMPLESMARKAVGFVGIVTVKQGGTGVKTFTDGAVLLGSGSGAITATTLATTEIMIGDGSGDPTFAALSGDVTMDNTGVVTIGAAKVDPAMITSAKGWFHWDPLTMSADGTQCTDAAQESSIAGPELHTIVCADNDAGLVGSSMVMPSDWDAGTVLFTLMVVQTGAETLVWNSDIEVQCRGNGEAVVDTWSAESALDIAVMTGTSGIDAVTSAAITPAGTCAAGDFLIWQISPDATGTTSTAATHHIIGVSVEYGIDPTA